MASRRVAVGMSGGVDSAVAAVVLMREGYECIGVTCVFHDEDAAAQIESAAAVCASLGISHVVHDCRTAFEKNVVDPFVHAYESGLTPSPCVSCNALVKVPELIRAADEAGCDTVATGHYARITSFSPTSSSEDEQATVGRFVVKTALDYSKDQSYMLALLGQEELSRLLLPLGGLTKADVRIIAADLGLPVADKPESQDICFAPQGYRALLSVRGYATSPGPIEDMAGNVVGKHTGLADYTIGQRKGIGVAAERPYYVVGKDAQRNCLTVGFSEDAMMSEAIVGSVVWQAFDCLENEMPAMVKLRYRSRSAACIIEPASNGRVRVLLQEPQTITAPGQCAVFSLGDMILGAGLIEEVRGL